MSRPEPARDVLQRSPPTSAHELAVEAIGLRKVYGPTVALAGVDFEVGVGEIHALLGENGAGKSTLVRIMAGVEAPDDGSLRFFGSPATGGPSGRRQQGLAFIHQDLGLFDSFSVADNLALGRGFERSGGFIREKATIAAAREVVDRLGVDIDVRRLVGELPLADQTSVAVCRALSTGARLVVLDEPTAYLEARQVRALFEQLVRLRDNGVACILITHRNEDVLRVSDRVTVLRDGRNIARRDTKDLTEQGLVHLITGRTDEPTASEAVTSSDVPTRMQVTGLCGRGFGPVSFEVGRGEVVGLCGLADAGQLAVGEALSGISPPSAGAVTIDGADYAVSTVADALRAGVGTVPADRSRDGLAGSMTAAENVFMDASGPWWRPIKVRAERERSFATLERFAVRPSQPGREVMTFSGGNQQKILLGKWLSRGLRLLILNEPSAGVDVGAKADIHGRIRNDCRSQGTSALVISTDFQEIVDLCDRAVVMRRGEVVAAIGGTDLRVDHVTELAYGGVL